VGNGRADRQQDGAARGDGGIKTALAGGLEAARDLDVLVTIATREDSTPASGDARAACSGLGGSRMGVILVPDVYSPKQNRGLCS